jgi:CHAD domain-containing protein
MDVTQSLVTAGRPAVDAAAILLKESFASAIQLFQRAAERGREEAEFVHELRIATRRAEAALELFRDFVPRRAAQRMHRKLAQLRKEAGPARDFDVFAARFTADSGEPVIQELVGKLAAFGAEGHATFQELYGKWEQGERLERSATRVLCGIAPRRSQAECPDQSFSSFAPRCMRWIAKRLSSDPGMAPTSLKRLHAFRIKVKEVRYCLELLRPGLPDEPFAKSYALVKKLTQRLGELNDHATAERILESLLANEQEGPVAEFLEQTLEAERQALGDSIARFKKWWSPRKQRRLRRRLKKTAAACDLA